MCRFDLILVIPSPVLLPTICLYSLHSHCFLNICTFCESFVVPLCSIISLPFFAIWTRAVELEGFSTWGVGVVENFNDSDSGQTFCSPIVTVCATNVTLGNLSSLMLQQEMIIAIQTDGSAPTCIPSLRAIPDQQRPWAHHTTYTLWMQPFGACITEISICSFWLPLSLLRDVGYATMNESSHGSSSIVT